MSGEEAVQKVLSSIEPYAVSDAVRIARIMLQQQARDIAFGKKNRGTGVTEQELIALMKTVVDLGENALTSDLPEGKPEVDEGNYEGFTFDWTGGSTLAIQFEGADIIHLQDVDLGIGTATVVVFRSTAADATVGCRQIVDLYAYRRADPVDPAAAADAAEKIAVMMGATEGWDLAFMKSIADTLAEAGFRHPGNPENHDYYSIQAKEQGKP